MQEVEAHPEACIVDQDVDGLSFVGNAGLDSSAPDISAEIGDQHLDVHLPLLVSLAA